MNNKIISCIVGGTSSLAQRSKSSHMLTIVRFGGARPGGMPTFNWKERKQLKLDELRGTMKNWPHGDFEDIEKYIDTTDPSYKVIKLADLGDQALESFPIVPDSRKKVFKTSLMFGPQKSCGMLNEHSHQINRKRRQPFSHRRVFGPKFAALKEQAAAGNQ